MAANLKGVNGPEFGRKRESIIAPCGPIGRLGFLQDARAGGRCSLPREASRALQVLSVVLSFPNQFPHLRPGLCIGDVFLRKPAAPRLQDAVPHFVEIRGTVCVGVDDDRHAV